MSVFNIFTNDSMKRKISARWVSLCLTDEQKPKRLDIATLLLKERFDVEEQAFFRRIVALDEMWIRDFKPESKKWRATGSPLPKNFDELNRRSSK